MFNSRFSPRKPPSRPPSTNSGTKPAVSRFTKHDISSIINIFSTFIKQLNRNKKNFNKRIKKSKRPSAQPDQDSQAQARATKEQDFHKIIS